MHKVLIVLIKGGRFMSMFMAADTGHGWLNELINAVIGIINPILIVAAIAGIIYAVVVGIRFVKADDKGARDEAKQKLISVIIGIVVTLVLVALFFWLANAISSGLINPENWI